MARLSMESTDKHFVLGRRTRQGGRLIGRRCCANKRATDLEREIIVQYPTRAASH